MAEFPPLMASDPRTELREGATDAIPILVALVPFSIVFGAIAIESGLSFGETLLTSMSIYAVASQYVMLDLMGQSVSAWLIVLSVFALNARHLLYSAAIGRSMRDFSFPAKALGFFLLVDPQYAAAEARAAEHRLTPVYYFSYAAVVYTTWIIANCIGALFGALIDDPGRYGLDFILPLYFTGLVMGFRRRQNFLPVLIVSAAVSLVAFFTLGSPWHITIGGLAGLVAAACFSRPGYVTESAVT